MQAQSKGGLTGKGRPQKVHNAVAGCGQRKVALLAKARRVFGSSSAPFQLFCSLWARQRQAKAAPCRPAAEDHLMQHEQERLQCAYKTYTSPRKHRDAWGLWHHLPLTRSAGCQHNKRTQRRDFIGYAPLAKTGSLNSWPTPQCPTRDSSAAYVRSVDPSPSLRKRQFAHKKSIPARGHEKPLAFLDFRPVG